MTEKQMQKETPSHALPTGTVRLIARQDASIGSLAFDARTLIARSTDAFLADLAKAAARRARVAAKDDLIITKGKLRVSLNDMIHAVDEEERFDFLRPVLSSLDDRKAATMHAKSSRSRTSRKRPGSRDGVRKPRSRTVSASISGEDEHGEGVEDEASRHKTDAGVNALPPNAEAVLRRAAGKGGALLTRLSGISAKDRRALIGDGSLNKTGEATCTTEENSGGGCVSTSARVDIDDDYDDC